jgi:hypothetical protein
LQACGVEVFGSLWLVTATKGGKDWCFACSPIIRETSVQSSEPFNAERLKASDLAKSIEAWLAAELWNMDYSKDTFYLPLPMLVAMTSAMTYGLKEQEGTCKPQGRIRRLILIGVQSPYSSEGFQSPSPSRLVTCKGCQRPCQLAIKQRLLWLAQLELDRKKDSENVTIFIVVAVHTGQDVGSKLCFATMHMDTAGQDISSNGFW